MYLSTLHLEVIGTRDDGYLVEDVLDDETKWVIPHAIFERYCTPISCEDELKVLKSFETNE